MNSVFYEQRSENVFAGFICDHPFPSHVHDVVEIVCLTSGKLEMTIGGELCALEPGDIAIAFPSIPHSYNEVSEDAQGLTLIFLPDTISEFTTHFRNAVPANAMLCAKDKAPELDGIVARLQGISSEKNHPLKLGYLHLFLSFLFCCIELQPANANLQSGLSHQVLHYIAQHFTEPLSLESTAHALGISRTHLSHIFSQQLGINFRQHINTLRINHACRLLDNPSYSISQVSDLCGYINTRTFHRAFLAQYHMSPSQYRARQLPRQTAAAQSADLQEEAS